MDAIPQGSFDVTGLLGSAFGAPAFAAPMPTAMPMAQPAMPNVSGLLSDGYQALPMERVSLPKSDVAQSILSQNAQAGGVPTEFLEGVDAVQLGKIKSSTGVPYFGPGAGMSAYGGLLSDVPVDLGGRISFEQPSYSFDFSNFTLPALDFSNIDLSGFSVGSLF